MSYCVGAPEVVEEISTIKFWGCQIVQIEREHQIVPRCWYVCPEHLKIEQHCRIPTLGVINVLPWQWRRGDNIVLSYEYWGTHTNIWPKLILVPKVHVTCQILLQSVPWYRNKIFDRIIIIIFLISGYNRINIFFRTCTCLSCYPKSLCCHGFSSWRMSSGNVAVIFAHLG